jgi:hypothetical protein
MTEMAPLMRKRIHLEEFDRAITEGKDVSVRQENVQRRIF